MKPQDNRRNHRASKSPTSHKSPPPREAHSRPSGTWRKKYDCKVNKGAHTLVLVKPDHAYRKVGAPEQTAIEYYDEQDAKYRECIEKRERDGEKLRCCWRGMYHFKCTACGKIKLMQKRTL